MFFLPFPLLCYFSSFRFSLPHTRRLFRELFRKSVISSSRKNSAKVVHRMMAEKKQSQWKSGSVEVFPFAGSDFRAKSWRNRRRFQRCEGDFLVRKVRDENRENSDDDSGAFFPLHFSLLRDFSFPLGHSPTPATPRNSQ